MKVARRLGIVNLSFPDPRGFQPEQVLVTEADIRDLVLHAMENVNLARQPEARLQVSADAPVFGAGSPLDSLGLVSLLIDIEEALLDRNV